MPAAKYTRPRNLPTLSSAEQSALQQTGFTTQQGEVLKLLGYPLTTAKLSDVSGNGRLQQNLNQRATLRNLPSPFSNSALSAFFQDILPLAAIGGAAAGGAGDAAGASGADAAGASATAGGGGLGKGALLGASAVAITSPLDFLKFIAWIFHPRNILRGVEFLVGFVLMIFGMQAALQARGEKLEGFTTSEAAISRAGLGRVATALGQSARRRERTGTQSAPHRTRREALRQRYQREERVRQRERSGEKPAGHSGRTGGSGSGTRP